MWFYDRVNIFFIISRLFVFRSAVQLRERGASWVDFYCNRLLRVVAAIYPYLALPAILVVVAGAPTLTDLASVRGLA